MARRMILAASICAVFCGCALFRNTTALMAVSKAAGVSTGYVLKEVAHSDPVIINAVCDITEKVIAVVPTNTEVSVGVLWKPYIDEALEKIRTSGKVNEKQYELIVKLSDSLVKAIDKLLKKNPKIIEYSSITGKVLNEFKVGLFAVVKPSDELATAPLTEGDADMYEYLMQDYK